MLTGFARAQGLKAEFDDTVSGRVSGRFQKVSARNFLTAMGEAYGAGWYVLGTSIHFYASDRVRKDFLTVPSGSAEDLVNSLRRSGFIADELPVKINNDANMLTFVGPEPYLAQIRTAAAAYLAVQTEKIVMRVFPVKYAWADDITLQNMDQTVTVPGIASILRGMVMGQSVSGTTVSQQRRTAQSVESLGPQVFRGRMIVEARLRPLRVRLSCREASASWLIRGSMRCWCPILLFACLTMRK